MQRQRAAERHESTTITFFNIFIFFKIVKMTFSNEKTPTDPRVIEDNETILEPEEEEDPLGLGEDDRKLLSSGMATLRDSGTVSRSTHHHSDLYIDLTTSQGGSQAKSHTLFQIQFKVVFYFFLLFFAFSPQYPFKSSGQHKSHRQQYCSSELEGRERPHLIFMACILSIKH